MRKTLAVLEPLFLLCLPMVFLVCAYAGTKYTALLTVLAACVSAAPFFLRFEKKAPRPRDIMPIVVLAAIAAAGRIVFAPFPNFKPVSAIVIISGASFGRQSGFLTGALAALASNMFFGQGPWTPWQMYAWGLIGYIAGILGCLKILEKPLAVYIFGFLSALIYGFFLDSWHLFGFFSPVTWQAAVLVYGAGLPFSLVHAVATVIFLLPTYRVWQKKLRRIKEKYALMEK